MEVDINFIAKVLSDVQDERQPKDNRVVKLVINLFSYRLAKIDPSFDRIAFLKACEGY